MENCPCGTGRTYEECCGRYIAGPDTAPTAEALMRSRYTAYVKSKVDYIVSTCTETEGIDLDSTRKWSEKSTWLGLKIHKTAKGGAGDTTGEVEFSATYVLDGLREEHREIAKFEKKDGKWLYSEGEVVPQTVVREGPKVGRNDPCPCGSGKKYKKCCGTGV
ncbi:MAG: YchJ family protein [Rectinemataceae bacterium]|nr:YchJ family protein [Rectinemataceae bacterium]